MSAHDVAVETTDGNYYQFINVREDVLAAAVRKGAADRVALSLVNTDSAAIVIPWRFIKRITYAPVDVAEYDEAWLLYWENEA